MAESNEMFERVYTELKAIAQARMNGERREHTLSATALVHEAYLKLAGPRDKPWDGKAHFFVAAVEAMRQILLDHARARGAEKRGAGRAKLNLDEAATLAMNADSARESIFALDEALSRLREQDARMADVVGLRFYAGLTNAEAAAILSVSERTVKNDWAFAKAWLVKQLGE